jgi:hypothetical protein
MGIFQKSAPTKMMDPPQYLTRTKRLFTHLGKQFIHALGVEI